MTSVTRDHSTKKKSLEKLPTHTQTDKDYNSKANDLIVDLLLYTI